MFKSLKQTIFAAFIITPVVSTTGVTSDKLDAKFRALLQDHNLPGLSVAVVDDYKLVYAGAFGEKHADTGEWVDENTAFSAASISKGITGLVAAMLAEQGKIDLDAPVSSYLKRWKLPTNKFTTDTHITMRHLLTHTAGTSQSGFADYFPGDDIPTPIESLNGQKLARYKKPVEVMWTPGSRFRYSGGGFIIAQVAIEDATGETLANLAEELLFGPLGMTNSTMHQNGHPEFLENVAKAHELDRSLAGPGGVPIYPQIAASGLWTTPKDMAKLLIEMQKALEDRGAKIISPWVARETTRIQTLLKAGGWGLGWMRYFADGNLDWFSHSGYNTGIGGQVMATMTGGRAIAVFGNGVHRVRVPAINDVIDIVIKAQGWGRKLQPAAQKPTQLGLNKLVGHYRNLNTGFFSPFQATVTIFEKDGHLLLDNSLGTREPHKMIHAGDDKYRIDEFVGAEIGLEGEHLSFFHADAAGPGAALQKLEEGGALPYMIARSSGFEAAVLAYEAWKASYPGSPLMQRWAFSFPARRALEEGRKAEAEIFYRLGLHFHPDDETLQSALAELQK